MATERRARRRIRVAWSITAMNLRAGLEYRTEFLLSIALGVVWQTSVVVFASVLLTRFTGLGGWTGPQVLLLASMRLSSHGLVALLLGPVDQMGRVLREGRIDSYLLRPLPVFRQVQLSWFSVNALGDLAVAATMLGLAVHWFDLPWTAGRLSWLAAGILGGFFAEGAVLIAMAAVTLHFPGWQYWSSWLQNIMAMVAVYPLSILPLFPRLLLTYLVPVAFIAYLPAAVLTDHLEGSAVPTPLAAASPLVGLAAYTAARLLWNASLNRYQGTNT
ncbi:ABC transporter permease [Kitasatospora sp. NPDC058444]|uniref:ABC transporter permease n=1 Tax=Kitasatospora sp. NPDC058444 TaxID=3346504 RepID=UPI00365964B1